jgi:PPK2 family polyphosphate:nucleotide phosphotransferase
MMWGVNQYRIDHERHVSLGDFDPDDTSFAPAGKEEIRLETARITRRLRDLQEVLFAEHRRKVLIVLQGMDTSGKDGTIRHVMGGFNPAGVRVKSFKKPTSLELEHDYLWRAHLEVPAAGEIVVFNRSHFEDVLVVRVHDLVPKKAWKLRYRQINDFEQMLAETGTLILKFFLLISRDEQRKRLQERIDDPTKRWKFQHGDLEERKLWSKYRKAYEDVLSKTSTKWAPWHIIPANAKWYRNYLVGSIIADALDDLDMKYPMPDLSSEVIE